MIEWREEWKKLAWIAAIFLACFYLPVGSPRFDNALLEAFYLVKWYAQEHVLLCLVPAFFIAGAIGVFVSQASVMRYLGPKANKVLAYGVASCSGSILAVCSCTILPLFAGIYRMGAASGRPLGFPCIRPALNILAITSRRASWGRRSASPGPWGPSSSAWSSGWPCISSSARRRRPSARPWPSFPRTSRPGPCGRPCSISGPWSASWSSPTGAGPTRRRVSGT
jgi:hypothetical protein